MENRIMILRKNNSKTQSQIAKYLGISQQSYSRYESENITPPSDLLNKLADFYNVSVDYLINKSQDEQPRQLEPDIQIIHRAYQGMDDKQKDKLKKILELTFDIMFDNKARDDDKK